MRNLLSEYMFVGMTIFAGLLAIGIVLAIFYGRGAMGNIVEGYINGFVAH